MTALKYAYKARKLNGQPTKGEVIASSLDEANEQVSQLGLIPISVREQGALGLDSLKQLSWSSIKELTQQVPRKEIMVFTQQLQTLYTVGVPIVAGLEMIASQCENPNLKKVILEMIVEISDGATLSKAMSAYPKVFNEVYINMVMVGEASGRLEQVLGRLYQVIEAEAENRAKVKSALFYPKLVVGMILVVFVVMINFIIPKMKGFYSSMDAGQLPLPTRIVVGISDFSTSYFPLIALIVVGGYVAFKKWVNTDKGRLTWDQFKLKMPILGALIIEIEMNSFCIVLEMLIRSGLGIVESLEILKNTLSNQAVKEDVEMCRKDLIAGGKMGESLQKSKTFPAMLASLLSIGEEAGSMDKVLDRSAHHYKVQVDYKLSTLSKAIEPILLGVTFGMVLLLALAIFLPIWSMSSAIRRG